MELEVKDKVFINVHFKKQGYIKEYECWEYNKRYRDGLSLRVLAFDDDTFTVQLWSNHLDIIEIIHCKIEEEWVLDKIINLINDYVSDLTSYLVLQAKVLKKLNNLFND